MTSGAGAGLALAGGAAAGVGGLMQKIAADETNSGAVRGIAGALSNAMVPGAAAAAITMMATNYRMQVAQRRGELDTQNALAGMTGSGVSYGGAAGLGFTPEEAVSNAVAFSQGAGFSGAGGTPLGLVRTGTSIGALAAYRGQMAAGAGGLGEASMRTAVALAQSSGLRGSRVDEYLQAIAANTGSLASQGLRTSIPGVEDFLRRAAVTPGLGATGMGQVRALGAVTGALGGARSQLLAPFQGLGENVLHGYAASRARSPVEAVQILESLAPNEIVQVLRDSGMPAEAIQGYLMSKGLHSSEAMGVGMMNLTGETPSVPRTRGYGASALKVASAQREAALVGLATSEDVALFQTQQTMDKAIMSLGAGGRDASAFLISTISETMSGVSGLVAEAVSALHGILAAVKQ